MYILVTRWDRHWQDGQRTYYETRKVQANLLSFVDGSEAVFIKLTSADRVEQGWRGTIHQLEPEGHRVYFVVRLTSRLPTAEVNPYESFRPGWFETSEPPPSRHRDTDTRLLPPFFAALDTTSDPTAFEDDVHRLLLVLGIHRAYRFPAHRQAGRADGFFAFGNLAVIYDCSLAADLETRKAQQINNYCDQLLSGQVDIPPNLLERVADRQRQVWLVTRGRSRVMRTILERANVIIKEIAVVDLKQIYLARLTRGLSESDLEARLRDIGVE